VAHVAAHGDAASYRSAENLNRCWQRAALGRYWGVAETVDDDVDGVGAS
jgi:hypothetical protein